jgi:hypothetical protein
MVRVIQINSLYLTSILSSNNDYFGLRHRTTHELAIID